VSGREHPLQGIFVGTFLIGLREGLEATLIVSIVAAFLKRNGKSIRPMLIGVGLAVALSIAVGLGLDLLSASLPQRQQELLETVIGVIAVVFVTTMIIWMNRNAFALKGELEAEASAALKSGSAMALVVMAFLAVLKEGFETAVFLLAAAQTTQGSRWLALTGGLSGIAVSIAIGVGIYFGGLKVNLGRFFKITGVFLVFIAAGLVLNTLRTAHEAGLVNIGQQQVFDFSAWMPARSVLGSLITGMFGIPSDPRLIEVLGWLLYAIPVLAVFLWPTRLAASPLARQRVLYAAAGVLAVAAAALPVFVPAQGAASPGPSRTAGGSTGHPVSVTLNADSDGRTLTVDGAAPVRLEAAGNQNVDGVAVQAWLARAQSDPGIHTPTVSLTELAALTGGRLPVGLGSARTPGPFAVTWTATISYTALSHGDALVGARAESNRVAVLTGGGLTGSKTVSVGRLDNDWATSPVQDSATAAAIAHGAQDRAERALWRVWLPILLAAGAATSAALAWRAGRSSTKNEERQQHSDGSPHVNERGVAEPAAGTARTGSGGGPGAQRL
jgi:high-affinity iron transporter